MNVASIMSLAMTQTYSDSTQISATDQLIYANISYHKIESAITENIWEDYFYDFFVADTVANQNEYSFQASSSIQQWIKRIISVECKRAATDDYYTLLTNISNSAYNQPLDYLSTQVPKTTGSYDIKDSSVFLYPTPTVWVTNGLRIQALVTLIDLVADGAESTVFPKHSELRPRHHLVALGMKPWIFQAKGMYNEKMIADQEFEIELNKMLRGLVRYKNKTVWQSPNLDYYKY